MPSKRRYGKKKQQTRKKVSSKNVFKIAKAAARSVIKDQAQAQWCIKNYGAYADATGQYSALQTINPGPDSGYLDDQMVQIQLPANPQDFGLAGTRKDSNVNINGVKVALRFELPKSITTARVSVYLAQAKDGTATTKLFNTPDQRTMLRATPAIAELLPVVKVLKAKHVKIQNDINGISANMSWKTTDVDIWLPFKKPYKLEFDGDNFTDYLNRRLLLCVKASYQFAGGGYAADRLLMCGKVTTYYRDV